MKLNWFRVFPAQARRRDPRKARPLSWTVPIEVLEGRKLMTVAVAALYTDVSQVAALYPRHAGPTTLFLNFDGGTVPIDPVNNPKGSTVTIRPFEEEARDNTQDRNTDIQDIIFKASEIFAPFDVQVQRIVGAGLYSRLNGATTIFIGGNEANSTTSGSGKSFVFDKYSYDETFNSSLDAPSYNHQINSDPYDIAFVDPVEGIANNPASQLASQFTIQDPSNHTHADVVAIAQGIAHEAGHTFGLSHIRADGGTDPMPLAPGTVNDVMSYDSRNQFFANQSLNLTSDNNNGTSTTFTGVYPSYLEVKQITIDGIPFYEDVHKNLVTQNSYATLEDVLGVRPKDEYANVADAFSVDPSYYNPGSPGTAPKPNLAQKSTTYGTLGRMGDYQVFTINASIPGPVSLSDKITVTPTTLGFYPEVLVYDSTGQTLINLSDPAAHATASLTLPSTGTYQIVVGSDGGDTVGSYSLAVTQVYNVTFGRLSVAVATSTVTPNFIQSPAIAAPTNAVSISLGAPASIPHIGSAPQFNFFTMPVPQGTKPKLEFT